MYLVIGTTVVRVVGTYATPDDAAAVASKLGGPDLTAELVPSCGSPTCVTCPKLTQRQLFKVDL